MFLVGTIHGAPPNEAVVVQIDARRSSRRIAASTPLTVTIPNGFYGETLPMLCDEPGEVTIALWINGIIADSTRLMIVP